MSNLENNNQNNVIREDVPLYATISKLFTGTLEDIVKNEYTSGIDKALGGMILPVEMYNTFSDYKDGKPISNIVLNKEIEIIGTGALTSTVVAIKDLGLSKKATAGLISLSSIGYAAVVDMANKTLDQAVLSWNQSDQTFADFSNKFTENSKNIKFEKWSDYFSLGNAVLRGGYEFSQLNGVDTFADAIFGFGEFIADSEVGTVTGDVVFGFFDKLNNLGATLGGELYKLTHDEIALNSSQSGNQETLRVIRRDPLILDLDSDGIETTASDGSVLFDSNADGVKRGTGWVGADDGLLVRDVDGDGTIDNGQELFGDATVKSDGSIATDGFDALADLDSNSDGVFDANDTAFEEVKVWQDANQDGISQADEMKSLAEAGVASIDLDATSTTTATDGGIISKTGSFTRIDGTTSTIGNLDFNQNAIYREFTDNLDTSALNGMMSMAGIGEVRDLQEAATQSPELADLLGKMNTESYTVKLGLAEDLLSEWTKTSDFSDTNNLETVTLEDGTSFSFDISDATRTQLDKIQTLETFSSNKLIQTNLNGDVLTITHGSKSRNYNIVRGQENVLGDSHFTAGWNEYTVGNTVLRDMNLTSVASGYNNILNTIKENIFTQTEYPQILENIGFDYNAESGEIEVDFDGVNEYLSQNIESDHLSTIIVANELSKFNNSSFTNYGWSSDSVIESAIKGIGSLEPNEIDINDFNSRNITLNGKVIKINVDGGDGSQILVSDNTGETLKGGNQSDTLLGGDGNDTLVGDSFSNSTNYWTMKSEFNNRGHDVLAGGKGNDVLSGGYGADTYIFNKGDGVDTISEVLIGQGAQSWAQNERDTIKFGEGLNKEDINITVNSSDLHITFTKNNTDKVIIKNFKNSTLETMQFADGSILAKSNIKIGTDLDDTLIGNSNDNVISGNAGSDTITGGTGDDILRGGSGVDTYKYSQGDGYDIIQQTSSDGTSTDTLELNIDHDDILFSRDGDDLNISFDNDILGSIEIDDYFTEQFNNNDALIIDANDEFQMQLSANSAKIRELLAGTTDDIDLDGGSVDGANQVTTVLDSSQMSDLWIPKNQS